MPEIEDVARQELWEMAGRWKQDVDRLRRIHESLPASLQEEEMLEGRVEPDFATETRAVIECVIPDRLEPAIQALREVAAKK